MFTIFRFCVAVNLLIGLSEQRIFDGSCSSYNVSPSTPFVQAVLQGSWYLYAAYDEELPLHTYDCIKFHHAVQIDGNIQTTEKAEKFHPKKSQIGSSRMIFNQPGEGTYLYQPGDGSSTPTQIVDITSDYYIELICVDQDEKNNLYVGVFTRSAFPASSVLDKIEEFFDSHNIDRSALRFPVHDSNKCSPNVKKLILSKC